jgi:2-polyprenyl-6-methoxyphenol hydroxylase-like FAD-dependent oxidoreductase
MDRIETVLDERAQSLGVTILRGSTVTSNIIQDDVSVTVNTEAGQSYQAKWLVGCDGGRSIVRKAAGFEFVGTEAKCTCYAVKCDLVNTETSKPGFHITKAGMYVVGPGSLHLVDFDGATFDRSQEITLEHLQTVLNRISGRTDIEIAKVHLASTFTDRSKQTTSYRKGRILLAGDAAHIHSPLGAQGLNLGLGDALNLGWKLAETVRRESKSTIDSPVDFTLLDTYECERHPIAAWVLEWTRVQILTLQPDLFGSALQNLIRDLINTADGTNLFIDRVWGLSQRYILGDSEAHSHPLVGSSVPDFELDDGFRLGPKLEDGKGLLLDFNHDEALKNLVTGGGYDAKVKYIASNAKDRRGLSAMLVRPDGVVAWVAEEDTTPDTNAAMVALQQWF